jgi:hypothetical protein
MEGEIARDEAKDLEVRDAGVEEWEASSVVATLKPSWLGHASPNKQVQPNVLWLVMAS